MYTVDNFKGVKTYAACSKVAQCKINTQVPMVSLYTSRKPSESEIWKCSWTGRLSIVRMAKVPNRSIGSVRGLPTSQLASLQK